MQGVNRVLEHFRGRAIDVIVLYSLNPIFVVVGAQLPGANDPHLAEAKRLRGSRIRWPYATDHGAAPRVFVILMPRRVAFRVMMIRGNGT